MSNRDIIGRQNGFVNECFCRKTPEGRGCDPCADGRGMSKHRHKAGRRAVFRTDKKQPFQRTAVFPFFAAANTGIPCSGAAFCQEYAAGFATKAAGPVFGEKACRGYLVQNKAAGSFDVVWPQAKASLDFGRPGAVRQPIDSFPGRTVQSAGNHVLAAAGTADCEMVCLGCSLVKSTGHDWSPSLRCRTLQKKPGRFFFSPLLRSA